MLKLTLSALAGMLLALGLATTTTQAQSRVFVAAQGSDSNPCTFALPCRTFQRAHNVVAAKGEIDVLDPAGYGSMTITKSISIQGHGFAGIAASGSEGILVNAGASDKVSLRGLLIDGIGAVSNGIVFTGGASLDIQDCVIRNFTNVGINFLPSATSALFVTNSHVAANGAIGIMVNGTGHSNGVIDHVVIVDNNTAGLTFNTGSGSARFTISESVVSNHGDSAVSVGGFGGPAVVTLRNTLLFNNLTGVLANGSNAVVRVTKSTITDNGTNLITANSGQIQSYSDNSLAGNTTNNPPSSTIALQ